MKFMIDELNVKGGRKQLIIVLTGHVGAKQSTAIIVAQPFLIQFCLVIGMLWSDWVFVVITTTYTGYVIMFIEGFIIFTSVFVFKLGSLTEKRQGSRLSPVNQ